LRQRGRQLARVIGAEVAAVAQRRPRLEGLPQGRIVDRETDDIDPDGNAGVFQRPDRRRRITRN
jgi:hypothetical protein